MSPTQKDSASVPLWKKPWIVVSGIAIVGASVLDFMTGAIGIAEKVVEIFSQPPLALAKIETRKVNNGPTCVKFAFERLPSDFTLGEIQFNVIATSDLRHVNYAATIPVFRADLDMKVGPDVLEGKVAKMSHEVNIQAEKDNDAAIVDVCPIPLLQGMSARLTVVPSFLSLAGEPIENIEIKTVDGSSIERGIELTVARYPTTLSPDYQIE